MGQVTAVNQEQRVYSENGKVFVGMKIQDANKIPEQMQIFNFVDVDKNGQISKKEIERYNAPILSMASPLNARGCGEYSKYTEFYAGLTIDKVNPEGRTQFTTMDLNSDGVLSRAEMDKAQEILDKKVALQDDCSKIRQKREDKYKKFSIFSGLGSILTMSASIILNNFVSKRPFLNVLTGATGIGAAFYFCFLAFEGLSGLFGTPMMRKRYESEAEKEEAEKTVLAKNAIQDGFTSDDVKQKIMEQWNANNLSTVAKP